MMTYSQIYQNVCNILDSSNMPPNVDDFTTLRSEMQFMISQIFRISDKFLMAPSVWHAAVFCAYLMAEKSSGIRLDVATDNTLSYEQLPIEPARHLVFRGEADCNYRLVPSIWRTNVDHELTRRKLSCFCPIVKHALDKALNQNTDVQLACAIAQHFGIPTSLMDWTTDPIVAIGFASLPKKKPPEHARVYILPTDVAVKAGGRFYLPPPYMKRLYIQRGLFIETADFEVDHALEEAAIKIEFPYDSTFRPIRNGKPVDLMSQYQWLEQVADWAKKEAELGHFYDKPDLDNHPKLVRASEQERVQALTSRLDEALTTLNIPDDLKGENANNLLGEWLEAAEDMLVRLTQFKPFGPGKQQLNLTTLQALICDNEFLIRILAKAHVHQAEDANNPKTEGSKEFATLLTALLRKCPKEDTEPNSGAALQE